MVSNLRIQRLVSNVINFHSVKVSFACRIPLIFCKPPKNAHSYPQPVPKNWNSNLPLYVCTMSTVATVEPHLQLHGGANSSMVNPRRFASQSPAYSPRPFGYPSPSRKFLAPAFPNSVQTHGVLRKKSRIEQRGSPSTFNYGDSFLLVTNECRSEAFFFIANVFVVL